MKKNPLLKLENLGQSIWMDFIRRDMIKSGELRRLVEEDGISGVTSNPSIFEKAIAESNAYDEAIRNLTHAGRNTEEIYQTLTIGDIQLTADILRNTYNRCEGRDGFVSLEVSPLLAHNTEGTIIEARRLWSAVDRPNVMIKVPGTKDGIPAIRQLIFEGININVTLLFGIPRYEEVTEAYLSALEDRVKKSLPIKGIASVASFFISRIDVLIDSLLETISKSQIKNANLTTDLKGQVAIANAKLAYKIYRTIFSSERFRLLETSGARTQRLLWASTGTKNPNYSDVKYVAALIGHDTINTLPLETIDAYRDHGHPRLTLNKDILRARTKFKELQKIRINIDEITQQLEDEGVQKFIEAYNKLLNTLKQK